MKWNTASVTSFLVLFALAGIAASARSATGSVTGTVVDPAGAVIPGATVTLTDKATGLAQSTETDEKGHFRCDKVAPGSYTLRISLSGFRTYETLIEVQADRPYEQGQITLEPGPSVETITLDGDLEPPALHAETPQLGADYGQRVVPDVIWGAMGLDSAALLTAGILPGFGNVNANTGTDGQFPGGDVPTAGGLRARTSEFALDGNNINDTTVGGPALFLANLDTVAEYEVTLYPFDVALGRLPGAHINIVTKSGTNDFHGSAFYFYESSGLRARTSFEDRFDNDKGKFVQQYYGGTFGGPLIKDKLFGFSSFSRFRVPNSAAFTVSDSDLALTQASAAALAALLPNSATAVYRDRGPFAIPEGNPRCNIRPFTTLVAGLPLQVCGIDRDVPSSDLFWEYSVRLDLVLQKQTFTGHWLHQEDDFCCSGGTSGYWVALPFSAWVFNFGHTYVISPRAINDFRFSAARFFVAFEGGNTVPGILEGTTAIRQNLSRFNLPTGFLDFGLPSGFPQGRLLYSFQWQDNFSYIWGRHTLKAGLEFRRYRTTAPFLPFVNGQYNFTSLSNLAFNNPATVSFAEGPFAFRLFETDQFYYLQDDIRLKPNLILFAGLRYEHTGQPANAIHEETRARESGAAGQTPFWNPQVALENRIFPRIPTDSNNWAPRVGFAYTPRFWKGLFGEDRTVIRGGYLVSYEAGFYNLAANIATSAPRVFSFSLPFIPVQGGGTGADLAAALLPFIPYGARDPREFTRATVADDFYSPYAQNWSFGLQREFTYNIVAEARYVGTRGVGLFQSVNANPRFLTYYLFARGQVPPEAIPCGLSGNTQIPSTFFSLASLFRPRCDSGPLLVRTNGGKSTYHALQTRVDFRNLFDQAIIGVGFTWSKTIDNVSEIFAFLESGSTAFSENPFRTNDEERGLSNFHLGRALTAYWIWESPWFREQKGHRGRLLGGWQWNGQLFFYDGRPWTPVQSSQLVFGSFCAEDSAFNSTAAGLFQTCRPYLGNPNAPVHTVGLPGNPNARWWINNGSLGPSGVGRNPKVYGDGTAVANMNFFKNTRFGREARYNLQFRLMAQNIFNHRNFGVPDPFVDRQSTFGRPGLNNAVGRLVRLGLRFTF